MQKPSNYKCFSKILELQLKQVSFKVSSESRPNFMDIENDWAISGLDIKHQPINVFKLKKKLWSS